VWLPTEIVENVDGKFLVLPNDGIGGHLKSGRRWEPHFTHIVQSLAAQGVAKIQGTFALDIGANMGCNTVSLARAVSPSGMVVSCEPLRIPYQLLCANAMLNGLFNVLAFNNAIGAADGALVQMQPVNYFASSINIGDTAVGTGGETVQLRTVDSFQLPNISFIKLDIQGSETAALQGARATVQRCRPLLFVEIEEVQLKKCGSTTEELLKLLFELGYILIHIKNDYPVDFLCVPAEQEDKVEYYRGLIEGPVTIIRP